MLQQFLGEDVERGMYGYVTEPAWQEGLVELGHYYANVNGRNVDINGDYPAHLYRDHYETNMYDKVYSDLFGRYYDYEFEQYMIPDGVENATPISLYQPATRWDLQHNASHKTECVGCGCPFEDRSCEKTLMLQTSLILDEHAKTGFDRRFDFEKALYALKRQPFFPESSGE